VAGEDLVDVTVSFKSEDDSQTEAIVRVASSKHVVGELPENATFVVDVEVRTLGDISLWAADDVLRWLSHAHDVEKTHFFALLPASILEPLKEI
jgi:hypothetical protein